MALYYVNDVTAVPRTDMTVLRDMYLFVGDPSAANLDALVPGTLHLNAGYASNVKATHRVPLAGTQDAPAVGAAYSESNPMFLAAISAYNNDVDIPEDIAEYFTGKAFYIERVGYGCRTYHKAIDGTLSLLKDELAVDVKDPETSDESVFCSTVLDKTVVTPLYVGYKNSQVSQHFDSYATRGGVSVYNYYCSGAVNIEYFCGSLTRATNIVRNSYVRGADLVNSYKHVYFVVPTLRVRLKDIATGEFVPLPQYTTEVDDPDESPVLHTLDYVDMTVDVAEDLDYFGSSDLVCYEGLTYSAPNEITNTLLHSHIQCGEVKDDSVVLHIKDSCVFAGCGSDSEIVPVSLDAMCAPVLLASSQRKTVQGNDVTSLNHVFSDTYWNKRAYASRPTLLAAPQVVTDGMAIDVRVLSKYVTYYTAPGLDDNGDDYPTAAYDGACETTAKLFVVDPDNHIRLSRKTDTTPVYNEHYMDSVHSDANLSSTFVSVYPVLKFLSTDEQYEYVRKVQPGAISSYAISTTGVPATGVVAPSNLTSESDISVTATCATANTQRPHIDVTCAYDDLLVLGALTTYKNTRAVQDFTIAAINDWDNVRTFTITLTLWTHTMNSWDDKRVIATKVIVVKRNTYTAIRANNQALYLDGNHPTRTVTLTLSPGILNTDSLTVNSSNESIATAQFRNNRTVTVTQVGTGRCTITIASVCDPSVSCVIDIVTGSQSQGGTDTEPDDYNTYPTPISSDLTDYSRAQHAYYSAVDWRTTQLGVHTSGFDHGIGRGVTTNAAPGTLYAVFSERSTGEYSRETLVLDGVADTMDAYIPQVLLQSDDDYWHTNYDAFAYLDTGNIGDRVSNDTKRFREVQYILNVDDDSDLTVAFAFLVDGAIRKPLAEPVVDYDPVTDTITVSTEYSDPYTVEQSTVGHLNAWTLGAGTLENSDRVRIRHNVTGKGITASTRIVFKTPGQFKLLGVNYVYRPMYSR